MYPRCSTVLTIFVVPITAQTISRRLLLHCRDGLQSPKTCQHWHLSSSYLLILDQPRRFPSANPSLYRSTVCLFCCSATYISCFVRVFSDIGESLPGLVGFSTRNIGGAVSRRCVCGFTRLRWRGRTAATRCSAGAEEIHDGDAPRLDWHGRLSFSLYLSLRVCSY
jgi:hypothetical protein